MKGYLRRFVLFAPLYFFPAALMAQTIQNDFRDSQMSYGLHQIRVVAGLVTNPKGDPIVHADIEILNNAGVPPRSIQTDSKGRFQSNYEFSTDSALVRGYADNSGGHCRRNPGRAAVHRTVAISALSYN